MCEDFLSGGPSIAGGDVTYVTYDTHQKVILFNGKQIHKEEKG